LNFIASVPLTTQRSKGYWLLGMKSNAICVRGAWLIVYGCVTLHLFLVCCSLKIDNGGI
jgi:hypothetical protein